MEIQKLTCISKLKCEW